MKKIISCLLLSLAVLVTSTAAHASPEPTGLWSGDIEAGTNRIAVVVEIEEGEAGALAGSLETPGQVGTPTLQLANVAASEENMAFDVPAIASRFEGRWSSEDNAWVGVWKQSGMELPLALTQGRPEAAPAFPELDGTWKGSIERGSQSVPFIFQFATSEAGTNGSFEAPAFGLKNIPLAQISVVEGNVSFTIPATGASYKGALSTGANTIEGIWDFPGQSSTNLTLERDGGDDASESRSQANGQQAGTGPAPYTEKEVTFPGGQSGDLELAGTLSVPEGEGPFPAAILLTGSGPQDRDQTLFGHKPFAVIADHLARNGIAVLRYDDRGYAKSQGNFIAATTADFADDAVAAMAYLRQQSQIDADAIGLIGHSEGAIVGNLAALASPDVGYLVSLAGPGTDFIELQLAQRRAMAKQAGFPEQAVLASEPVIVQFYRSLIKSEDQAAAKATATELLTPALLQALGAGEAMKDTLASHYSRDWFRFLLQHDAPSALSQLDIPVLALGGSLDQQVPSEQNLAGIRQALADNPDAAVVEIEGVNHMLQTATTGSMAEYEAIEETVSPAVLELLAEWITARFKN